MGLQFVATDIDAIIATSLDAAFYTDGKHVIRGVNSALESMIGWTHEQLVGRDICSIFPELHAEHATNLGEPLEISGLHEDGKQFFCRVATVEIDSEQYAQPVTVGFVR